MNISPSNILNKIFPPSTFTSLTDLLGISKLDLSKLVAQLTYIKPESVNSLHDLADKIKECPHISDEELLNVCRNIIILSSRQFSRPVDCSVRELIANALDAHIRAHNENRPIKIKVKKNCLIITDYGDGFGYGSIINYFVQGRSSNASQSTPAESRTANVTGRFGQGGMSALYFLLYHTLTDASIVPGFKVEDNRTTLNFTFSADGNLYEATCVKMKEEENVRIEICKQKPKTVRKISIKSRRGSDALKIKLFDEAGTIRCNVSQIDPRKIKASTRYKIVSDLIETETNQIIQSIYDNFSFVTSSPIQLNGHFVNDFKQVDSLNTENLLQESAPTDSSPSDAGSLISYERKFTSETYRGEGGTFSYSPLSLPENRKGSLLICEGGKTIMEFPLSGHLVPEKFALSFNYLKLTQDRNSLDYKDPTAKEFIKNVFLGIWNDSSRTAIEKSSLLNALEPLLSVERFDLLEEVKKSVSASDGKILPDLVEFENLENVLLLNPKYLEKLNFPIFYSTISCCFYLLPWPFSSPIICSKLGGKEIFFLDNRLFGSGNKQLYSFNLLLINQWLEQKNYGFKIYSESISPQKQITEKTEPEISPRQNIIKKTDFEKYEKALDSEEIAVHFTCEGLGIDSNADIPKEKQEKVLKFLQSMMLNAHKQLKKVARYFFDLLCNDDEILEFCLNNQLLLPMIKCNCKNSSTLFFQAYSHLKTYPDEAMHYRAFYKQCMRVGGAGGFEILIADVPHYYRKWKTLMDTVGITDEEVLLEYNLNIDFLDSHLILVEHILGKESNLLACIAGADDVPYLLSLPSDQLEIIFELKKKIHKSLRSFIFNRKDYDKMLSLYDEITDIEHKEAIIVYYFYFKRTFHEFVRSPFSIDLAVLEEELVTFSTENQSTGKTSSILKDIGDSLANIANINFGILEFIKKYGDLVRSDPTFFSDRSCIPALTQWASTHFIHFTPEQLSMSIEGFYDWYQREDVSISPQEFFLHWYEKQDFILPQARPIFYAILLGKDAQFYGKDFPFPDLSSSAIPLHQDPDVLGQLKEEKLAETLIQNALCQSVKEFDWILEAVKNCVEAGAKNIDFKVYLGTDKKVIVEIKDDAGMKSKNIKALKIPGVTTKRKDKEDPNYGWGFFTLLNRAEEVYGTTSVDGISGVDLHFKKNVDGMLFHNAPTEECAKGTKFLLKMNATNPTRFLVQIMANVKNICRHHKGVTVTFNDKTVSGTSARKTEVTHRENLVENGKVGGICEIKLGKTDEGLYRDNLRIESISEEYLSLLPATLKKEMKDDGMHFSIFLPKVKQNLNRNQLIDHSSTCSTIRRGVLATSIKYTLNKCLKGFKPKSGPSDFWYDFRTEYKRPEGILGRFIDVINRGDWNPLCDPQEADVQQQIFDALVKFFAASEMQQVNFPYRENSLSLEQLFDCIRLTTQEKHLADQMEHLKNLLEDKRVFAQLMLFLPIKSGGPTLNAIFNMFKAHLKEVSILTQGGEYSENLSKLPFEICAGHLLECTKKVYIKLDLDQNFDSVMNLFTSSISEKIQLIQVQEIRSVKEVVPCPALEDFLKQVAKKLLSKEIQVEFYAKSDGAAAYTRKNSTIIYVNQTSRDFEKFNSLLASFGKNQTNSEERDVECLRTIVRWLEILCHEMTHQKENEDCHTTHDEVFRDQLSELLLKLLVIEGEENCLDIFRKSCNL